MKYLFLVIVIEISFCLQGQSLQFKPMYQQQVLDLNKKYVSKNDTLEIEALKFYISNLRIEKN